jgi:hypothetical protein
MTNRLLHLLPALLILAAVLLPLGSGVWRLVQHEPDLHWTLTDEFVFSGRAPETEFYQYGTGFRLILANEGTASTAPIRITLDRAPVDLAPLLPDDVDYTEFASEEDAGVETDHVIELTPLPPGKRAAFRIWGMGREMIRSIEADGSDVRGMKSPLPDFQPEPWLPNWAVLSAALVLAGLALQNLRLRRELGVSG